MRRLTTPRSATLLALVLLAATAVGLSGCKDAPAKLTSAWPFADKERAVEKPADPLRWPYTGSDATDETALRRRPLSVKIENSPASRPQLNLAKADVVYETITEGGITRFNAIYHSTVPDEIGPVRSARFSDLWIVPQYDGLFFFSGASSTVNGAVNRADLPNLSEDAGISRPYYRSTKRSAPHNLILDTEKAYAEASARGYATTATLEPLQFERSSAESTPTALKVTIPFSQANTVRWEYDAETGRYLRWNNGKPHKDAATGEQIDADNVVVMWVKYTPRSRDKGGSVTYDVELGGQGRVTVIKNGQRFDGTWTAERTAPPRFKDAKGRPIKLTQGRTWFQVIKLDGSLLME